MKINLAIERFIYAEPGFKVLTEAQLAALCNRDVSTNAFTLAAAENLSLICDMAARYKIESVVYFRSRATTDTITIYGRQSTTEPWTVLPTVNTTTATTATIAGSSVYRYVRIVHSVTAGSAGIKEVELYSQDNVITFGSGEQGTLQEYSIDSGTEELATTEVFVRNVDSVPHDFYFLLDPTDVDSANYGLSLTSSGVFHPLYSTGVSLPVSYAWSAGSLANTVITANTVRLGAAVSGTYFSPVLDLNGLEGRRLFWRATISGATELDVNSQIDSLPTIEIRMSNTAPTAPWASGQLSTDSTWSVVSGTLPFTPAANYTVLNPAYRRYFQARVEFRTTVSGQTPVLEQLGIETGIKLPILAGAQDKVYVKSLNSTNHTGSDTALVCWYFEDRNIT